MLARREPPAHLPSTFCTLIASSNDVSLAFVLPLAAPPAAASALLAVGLSRPASASLFFMSASVVKDGTLEKAERATVLGDGVPMANRPPLVGVLGVESRDGGIADTAGRVGELGDEEVNFLSG